MLPEVSKLKVPRLLLSPYSAGPSQQVKPEMRSFISSFEIASSQLKRVFGKPKPSAHRIVAVRGQPREPAATGKTTCIPGYGIQLQDLITVIDPISALKSQVSLRQIN